MERPFTTLSSQQIWQSRWYNLRQDRVLAPDGSELTYTIVDKLPAVWIVPVTADGHLILIEQYRYAVENWCLEVPAGTGEPGVASIDLAARELREEIGGTAEQIIPMGELYIMPGISNAIGRLFLALGVTLSGETQREASEIIHLRPLPAEEAFSRARSGQMNAGMSALAILRCEAAIRKYLGGER